MQAWDNYQKAGGLGPAKGPRSSGSLCVIWLDLGNSMDYEIIFLGTFCRDKIQISCIIFGNGAMGCEETNF